MPRENRQKAVFLCMKAGKIARRNPVSRDMSPFRSLVLALAAVSAYLFMTLMPAVALSTAAWGEEVPLPVRA